MREPVLVDCNYLRPQFAAAYLVVEDGHAAVVENNTSRAWPLLEAALAAQGVAPGSVELAMITHVHLDHAGGSGTLMRACANATLLAHPRAVPHVVDPSRLVASARKVYGDEVFDRLYGDIPPVPAGRVHAVQDGEQRQWRGRTFTFLHTRGHANHHACILDSGSGGIFTGDAFGLAYPALQGNGLFVFPSTSPTDLDPEAARASIDRVVHSGAERAHLTHFGTVTDLPGAAAQLHGYFDAVEELAAQVRARGLPPAEWQAFCAAGVRGWFERALERRGLAPGADAWALVQLDVDLNAQGMVHWMTRHAAA